MSYVSETSFISRKSVPGEESGNQILAGNNCPCFSLVIEAWRREYNEERPKKSLGGLTPATYARKLAEKQLH